MAPDPSSGEHRIAPRERRRVARQAISLSVRVEAPGLDIAGVAADLGLGGMFVSASATLPYAAEVNVFFEHREIELRLPAVVRWVTAHGFGLQFGPLGARETHALVLLLTAP